MGTSRQRTRRFDHCITEYGGHLKS